MADQVPTIDEIDNVDKLDAYLRGRPVEEAQVIAFRAALRVMPLLSSSLNSKRDVKNKITNEAIMRVFRASVVSWISVAFANTEINASPAALEVKSAKPLNYAKAMAGISRRGLVKISTRSAAMAAFAGNKKSAIRLTCRSVSMAERAISSTGINSETIWHAVRYDLTGMINSAVRSTFYSALWLDVATLYQFDILETEFKDYLFETGDDWFYVIWSWYSSFRLGVLPYSHLEHRLETVISQVAKELDDFWERDPDAVMLDISGKLHFTELQPKNIDCTAIEQIADQLVQTPADFRFSSHDNQPIDAVPFKDAASNRAFAETTLIDAVEKAQEFREGLEKANADPSVKRSVDRLLAVLPPHLDALNPALMRSKTRSLEASALAYASAGAEAELFPNAVAELLDLVGTLKDLQGCFPQIAEVERNTVAIEIAGREQEVETALSAITASARALSANYPGIITASAVEAVAILDDDIADASNQKVKRNLLAGSALIKHNYLSAVYRRVLSPIGVEAVRVGKLYYKNTVDGSVVGVKTAAEKAFPAFVAYQIGGTLAAAAVFLPDLFKILKQANEFAEDLAKDNENEPNAQ
ncbi:hypothetical protein [Agrobacterium vitis]|uniref:Uncharacterized protein n=1 Tax=Agrobacterium vitis TaxID=373 RepID=A0AAE2RBY1_AGRVI|nr:hypothetical protein [Agrobacterium vitis]MBF2715438.1 hypothetical protein [Agrobacterium vitis]